jgi:hypothetical protein
VAVAVADAVEVVVLQDATSTIFVGPLAEQNVLCGLVFVMGVRPVGRVERLMTSLRQRDVPLRKINLVTGWPIDRVGRRLALHVLAQHIRIDVHDVVRVDEIDGHDHGLPCAFN